MGLWSHALHRTRMARGSVLHTLSAFACLLLSTAAAPVLRGRADTTCQVAGTYVLAHIDYEHGNSSKLQHSLEISSSSGVSGYFGDAALCRQLAGLIDLVGLDTEWAAANLVSGRSVLRVLGVVDGHVLTIAPDSVPQKVSNI